MSEPSIDAVFRGCQTASAAINGVAAITNAIDNATSNLTSTISDIYSRRDGNYSTFNQPQVPTGYIPATYVWANQPSLYGNGFSQQVTSGYPGISNDGYGKIGYSGFSQTGQFNFQGTPSGPSNAWYSDSVWGGGFR